MVSEAKREQWRSFGLKPDVVVREGAIVVQANLLTSGNFMDTIIVLGDDAGLMVICIKTRTTD